MGKIVRGSISKIGRRQKGFSVHEAFKYTGVWLQELVGNETFTGFIYLL